MSKEKKKKLEPSLRFPEFYKKNTWKERKLSEVLFEHDERSTGTEEVFSVSVHKGVVNQIEHLGRSFSAANTDNYKRVFLGDVIYTKSPTGDFPYGIIKQSKISKPVIVSPLYGVFKPETMALGVILNAYFEYPSNVFNYLSSIVQKGAKNTINITNDTFLSKSLIVPIDEYEQQKIADCLSSLDDLINSENLKLEVFKSHKKGLMQKLFPAEKEKMPELRFKEFENSEEWEESPLSKFIDSLDAGVSVNSGDKPAGKGEVGILKTSCVTKGFFEPSENKVVFDLEEIQRLREPVSKNTIIISRMNTPALVGANAYVDTDLANIFLPDRLWAAKSKSNANMRFTAYILGSLKGRTALSELASGTSGSMKNISKSDVLELRISAPDFLEQQKIADCLTSLDGLINAQAQKVDALKRHKKGLVQRLFPNAIEA